MVNLPVDMGKDHPPMPSAADKAYTVAKAAIAAVPFVGGPVAELLTLLAPPIAARQNAWLESIAERLRVLEATDPGVRIEDLKDNPSFVSTILQATQSAMRTHQKAKIDALRNAVLNTASGTAPDDDLTEVFLSLVDSLPTLHLQILEFFLNDRSGNVQEFPMLRDWDLAQQAAADLAARGLIEGRKRPPTAELFGQALYDPPQVRIKEHVTDYFGRTLDGFCAPDAFVTDLGKKFLKFITEEGQGQALSEPV
jgi:hypothetical protein